MDKVTLSSKNITPFGGLNFILNAIDKAKLPQFIDYKLGYRSPNAIYSYSDIVLSLLSNSLTQGSFISDLASLKLKFSDQIFNAIPSADTVEYACQELKTNTIFETSTNNVQHELNYNQHFNESLVALLVKTGQLKVNEKNIFDFDNVVIPNEKQDAKKSYKHKNGYHPNIAFINRNPVHIENHNENTPAVYKQAETLARAFSSLEKNGIGIDSFRADSASCQAEVFDVVEKNCNYFFVRARRSGAFISKCDEITNWKTVEVGYKKTEVTSMQFAYGINKKQYRVVLTRYKKDNCEELLLPQCAYTYQGIVTNSELLSEKEVIEFYNQRGDSEKSNCYLLNDFNCNHLPFMDFDTNTVYLYLMAFCGVLFEWTKTILVKNRTPFIKLTMRTKAVCYHYIIVASQITNRARKKIITIFSDTKYSILQI